MKHRATYHFWACYRLLPDEIKVIARKNYALWKANPNHPSLQFKKLENSNDLYSVRVGRKHRALGLVEEGILYWYWIGTHADYNRLVKKR